MNGWNQAPLIRLIIPFIAGIITAVYFPFQFQYGVHFIIVLTIVFITIVLLPSLAISYGRSLWTGLLINVLLFSSAYQLTIFKTEKFNPDHFSKHIDNVQYVYVRVKEPYIEKEKSLKAIVEILNVRDRERWRPVSGKAMVYFEKEVNAFQLRYGDELIMKFNCKEVPSPQNPGEFNYKRYLAFHNIFHQAYVSEKEWINTGTNTGNFFLVYCIGLRDKFLKVLTENHLKDDEFSVGAALLLGYTDRLDADIISAYASTGALHVLSVSGLHVAIVYVVFNWLLFFLDKIKYGAAIKAILLILFLWFYAALTGLSPSVLRAATMFSFIILAKAYKQYTNVYNTLAVSAFLLLLINPYLIMEVGFQLSYLAVIGIVYIQPKIYSWFEVNNWILDQVWSITAVSIAAQIATFPLGLLYFHQFPNYFLLSNLIVIPLSTAIIYLGIGMLSFIKISLLAKYLAIGFSWSIWLLNESVKMIEHWPYALLQGISISVTETWLMYGLIILILYFFAKRKFVYLLCSNVLLILILGMQVFEQNNQYQQKKLFVYNVPKTSVIDFIDAKNNVLLTDSMFSKNESRLLFHVKHNWWDSGINNTNIISSPVFKTENLNISNRYIQFYDKRIVIVNDTTDIMMYLKPFKVDYLIISKNSKIKISDVLKRYCPKTIVFDSSNSKYRIAKWKNECSALKQPYYSVPDSGALVISL